MNADFVDFPDFLSTSEWWFSMTTGSIVKIFGLKCIYFPRSLHLLAFQTMSRWWYVNGTLMKIWKIENSIFPSPKMNGGESRIALKMSTGLAGKVTFDSTTLHNPELGGRSSLACWARMAGSPPQVTVGSGVGLREGSVDRFVLVRLFRSCMWP